MRVFLGFFLAMGVACASPAFPVEEMPCPPEHARAGDLPEAGGGAGAGPPSFSWNLAAGAGPTVGEIRIRPENIFDLQDPRENNRLFRLANRLHSRTRPYVVRDQLLFRTGDRYDPRLLEESERILRANGYFYDARIRPVGFRDNTVDVEVVTRDVWTLMPGFSFKREGGRNTTTVDLQESNLFGRGSVLKIARSSTPERDQDRVRFADDHLFGTRFRTDMTIEDNSDGKKRDLQLERPFHALDARGAGGGFFTDDDRIDALVGAGPTAGRYCLRVKIARVYGGWSRGLVDGWVWRFLVGGTRDESRFAAPPEGTAGLPLPADRVLAYPFAGIEVLQDRFDKVKNRDQIERTEDFYMGTRLRATLGYATPALGSDREACPFSASVGNGMRYGDDRWTFLWEGSAEGRIEENAVRDAKFAAGARLYLDLSKRWLAYASVSGSRFVEPDHDRQITLGGDSGLRGYPVDYQAGDRKLLVTLEQRFFTEWYPFRLFRVGGAAFFDAGRAWGGERSGFPATGVLRDAGVGLRIGNARSGLGNVIHVDLAFPFDGDPSIARAQVNIVTKKSF